MPYTEFDLSTATLINGATFDGTSINGMANFSAFVFPGLAITPGKSYRFRFDLDGPGPAFPVIRIYSLQPDEDLDLSDYWQYEAVAFGTPPLSGSYAIDFGPGNDQYDTAIADGETHLYFEMQDVIISRVRGAERSVGTETIYTDWFQEPNYSVDQPATIGEGPLGFGGTAFNWTFAQAIQVDGPPPPPLGYLGDVFEQVADHDIGTWGTDTSHDPIGFTEDNHGGIVRGVQGWDVGAENDSVTFAAHLHYPYVWQPFGAITPLDPTEPTDPDDPDMEYVGIEYAGDGSTTIVGAVLNLPYRQVNYDTTQDAESTDFPMGPGWKTRVTAIYPTLTNDLDEPIEFYDAETHITEGTLIHEIPKGGHGSTGTASLNVLPYLYDSLEIDPGNKAGHFAFTMVLSLEGLPVAGAFDGRMGAGANPDTAGALEDFYLTYTVEQPLYRYLYEGTILRPIGSAAPPILRVHPRRDGRGTSTAPNLVGPRSMQATNRVSGGTFY